MTNHVKLAKIKREWGKMAHPRSRAIHMELALDLFEEWCIATGEYRSEAAKQRFMDFIGGRDAS
jgi:hypothetical protein